MVSVTQVIDSILEPEIVTWMLREGKAKCERISTEAKRVGSVVDQTIKHQLQPQRFLPITVAPTDLEVLYCLDGWQRFLTERPAFPSQVVTLHEELTDGLIVGHPDFELDEGSRHGILDVKCSRAIYPRYWTQTAKYLQLKHPTWQQCSKTHFIAVLRLDKQTGAYEYQEWTAPPLIQEEIDLFDCYYRIQQHGVKVREVMRQLAEKELLDYVA